MSYFKRIACTTELQKRDQLNWCYRREGTVRQGMAFTANGKNKTFT